MKVGVVGGLALSLCVACASDSTLPTADGGYRDGGDVRDAVRDGGPESGTADADSDSGTPPDAGPGPDDLLSSTGLYADVETGMLADGVREYQPRFSRWWDGAELRRWVRLPEGVQIDTTDMDYWRYPAGTKLWREATRDGVRIETSFMEKMGGGDADWRMVAFQWREDGTGAVARPRGVENASGTQHDIASAQACRACHDNLPGRALGFSAIQLSHDGPGLTLDDLIVEGRLSDPPGAAFGIPGDAVDRAALGYLHANCGGCHNPHTKIEPEGIDMFLWLAVDSLTDVESTSTYDSSVNEGNAGGIVRIVPGDLENSEIYQRMNTRDGFPQMPPIGSERVDMEGLDAIAEWIVRMPPE